MLSVQSLSLTFPAAAGATDGAPLPALQDVTFALTAGERLGVAGESGAGKSLLAAALINLVPPPGKITAGRVLFEGADLLSLPSADLRRVRGRRIASVFQDPTTTLNPVLTIGEQLTEILRAHDIADGSAANDIAVETLRQVAIPSPAARLRAYPHELSGGMRQRVVIAAALIATPALIIADEPTTALDVTTQAEIMHLLSGLCAQRGMGLILITHDLSLLSQTTDTLMVMYAGRVAERGASAQVVRQPRHPYTRGLLDALGGRDQHGRFSQIRGNMPPLSDMPNGCAFHPRCPRAQDLCRADLPHLPSAAEAAGAACHYPLSPAAAP